MSVRLFFAWYDLWIGVYYDRVKRTLYVCPLPCVVIQLARDGVDLRKEPA